MTSDQITKHWLKRMFECEAAWEDAKKRYSEIRESYTRGVQHDPVALGIALDRAGSDQRLKNAVKDTQYHREEMMAYATLIQTWRMFPEGPK